MDEFYCDGQMHTASVGSIVVINPYEVHTGRPMGSVPLLYRSLYPSPQVMSEIASQLAGSTEIPYFPSPVIRDEPLAKKLLQVHRVIEKAEDNPRLQSLLFCALSELVTRHSDKGCSSNHVGDEHVAIKRTKEYISDYYSENITLDRLAQISGLSPYHLLRAFRQAVGLPPHEYLVNVRIEHARTLLTKGHSIAQAAYETGFADQSHLTRHFKRSLGVTPGQYIS